MSPKHNKSSALAKEIHCKRQPISRPKPSKISAAVAAQPVNGMTAAGKNQLSLAT